MRRRHKVGSPLLIGAAVVILLCILSAVYSGISGNSSPITRAAGVVVRPFQRFGTGVGHFFSKGLDYFTEFDALKAENEQLKQQISDNAQLVRDAQIALEENNQLRSQLGQPENTAPPPRSAPRSSPQSGRLGGYADAGPRAARAASTRTIL